MSDDREGNGPLLRGMPGRYVRLSLGPLKVQMLIRETGDVVEEEEDATFVNVLLTLVSAYTSEPFSFVAH